jgi:hypothetical protein
MCACEGRLIDSVGGGQGAEKGLRVPGAARRASANLAPSGNASVRRAAASREPRGGLSITRRTSNTNGAQRLLASRPGGGGGALGEGAQQQQQQQYPWGASAPAPLAVRRAPGLRSALRGVDHAHTQPSLRVVAGPRIRRRAVRRSSERGDRCIHMGCCPRPSRPARARSRRRAARRAASSKKLPPKAAGLQSVGDCADAFHLASIEPLVGTHIHEAIATGGWHLHPKHGLGIRRARRSLIRSSQQCGAPRRGGQEGGRLAGWRGKGPAPPWRGRCSHS